MDPVVWEAIMEAVDLVQSGKANRYDGEGFKVYRAGPFIRVDISEKENTSG